MPANVLVVDDDAEIRQALAQILSDEGFTVREASNGLQALEEIAASAPDLVLLDLMMPVMTGWEVLRTMRRSPKLANVPVVVLSAVPASGCVDYFQKPISLDKLLSLLDTIKTRSMRMPTPTS